MLSPAYLLRLKATHQRFHNYINHHEFVRGVDNRIYNRPSCSRDLTYATFLTHTDASYPQNRPWRLWTPPGKLVSMIDSALQRATSTRDSLILYTPPPISTGKIGPSSVEMWTSNPYYSCTRIQSLSTTTPQGNTGQEPSPPAYVK